MEDLRVLYIVPSLTQTNGVASYAMNYFRHFENTKVDFLITSVLDKTEYCEEVLQKGGEVFYIKSNDLKKLPSALKEIDAFFKKKAGCYDIIHCHVASLGLLYLYFAKKYRINTRIIHAHATVSASTLSHKIRNDCIALLTLRFATDFAACSEAAGQALFGKRSFAIVKNGIDLYKYRFSQDSAKKMRENLNVEGKCVIGNVGRLTNQKNQRFLVKVANYLRDMTKNFVIMIIGNGELEVQLKSEVAKQGLEKYFLFLGKRSDVMELYNAMDVFVLPSLYEGLPVAGVEAQANGLPCLFADTITREVDLSGESLFLSIDRDDSAKQWADAILRCSGKNRTKGNMDSYDITKCVGELENYYRSIVES